MEEFKTYLDFSDLLPRWKYLLDVVNCAKSINEFKNGHYLCTDTGGAYSHKRAKYMGAYGEKNVSMVAEIKALVIVSPNMEEFTIRWKNTGDEAALIDEARKAFNGLPNRVEENKTLPYQVFLLDKITNSNFKKDGKGGMFGSKQYFPNIQVNSIEELVKKIDGKNWSDFLK